MQNLRVTEKYASQNRLLSAHDAHAMLMRCCLTDTFDCQLPAIDILFVGLRDRNVTFKEDEIEKGQAYKYQDWRFGMGSLDHLESQSGCA